MSEIIIRRMTAEDVEAVYAIECEAFSLPWSKAALMSEMRENPVARYLVAQKDGILIGYAGIHIILDEGHITNIAVSRNMRGKGIGTMLLTALLQYAANLGVVYATLEVRVSNEAALKMYANKGFIKVHVRKKYYEDNGEDAYLMVFDQLPPAQDDFSEAETITI